MATIDGDAHAQQGVGVHQVWRRDLGLYRNQIASGSAMLLAAQMNVLVTQVSQSESSLRSEWRKLDASERVSVWLDEIAVVSSLSKSVFRL